MLLSSFFILDFEKSEGSLDIDIPDNGFLCYRISDANISGSNAINKKLLSSYKKNQFCLLVSLDKEEAKFEEMINSLVPYTFFYNYLKFDYENPFLILETQRADKERYVELAKKIFNQHGYKDVDLIVLNRSRSSMENDETNTWFDFPTRDGSFASNYVNTIIQISSANSFIYFSLNDSGELLQVFPLIEEAESMICRQFSQIYRLLTEQKAVIKKQQEMRFQLGLQQEQIDSLNNYHSFYNSAEHRYGRQVKELITFYKNEYEILPMWYKRLGHVLKVITGRRTFRSLFSDNVKKYKV